MTSISVYHKTVPNNKNLEKIELLKYFSEGAKKVGDQVFDVYTHSYRVSDVAIIQGWINDTTARPHLFLRNQVIQSQLRTGKHVIAVDSNLFLYANSNNPQHYLRYSFDGIFPNTGNYCDRIPDPIRWKKISKNLGISLKPYIKNGTHILLCLQRHGGWSMRGYSVLDWAADTIIKLREYTDRPIVVRPHPGDKGAEGYLGNFDNEFMSNLNVRLSLKDSTLIDDLQDCWAAVNHNSSPVVGAAIEGVPIFVTDPERSQCKEIANTDLSQIENPMYPDREDWVQRLAMSHWNFDELRSGECWRHMRQFIS